MEMKRVRHRLKEEEADQRERRTKLRRILEMRAYQSLLIVIVSRIQNFYTLFTSISKSVLYNNFYILKSYYLEQMEELFPSSSSLL